VPSRLSPGELCCLLERCRANDAIAWEHLTAWVTARGHAVLSGVATISRADREDVIADALKNLITVVRHGGIRGTSNAEIDGYVCMAIRNRALNLIRGRARRRDAGEMTTRPLGDGSVGSDPPDGALSQDAQAIAADLLERAEKVLLSWPAADRYLFIAKLNGVSAKTIRATLEGPPFESSAAVTTVDTRFHRLRRRLVHELEDP